MMQMYFYASERVVILFEGWKTTTWEEMLGSCIVVAIMAALYEGFKVLRDYIDHRLSQTEAKPAAGGCGCEGDTRSRITGDSAQTIVINVDECECRPRDATSEKSRKKTERHPILETRHIIQSVMYFFQLWISLLIMLIFMTYNVYVCLAVATGGMIGHFCFAWMKQKKRDYDNETCH